MKTPVIYPFIFLCFSIGAWAQSGQPITHKVVGKQVVFSNGEKVEIPRNPTMGKTYILTKKENKRTITLELTGESDVGVAYVLSIKTSRGKDDKTSGKVEVDYNYLFIGGGEEPFLDGTDSPVSCMPYRPVKQDPILQICLADAEEQEVKFPKNTIFVNADIPIKNGKAIHLNGFAFQKK